MSSGAWLVWARGQTQVPAADRVMLGELALLADDAGLCSASINYLVQATGVHRSTVFRSLERLEKAGLISREAQYDATRARRESLFQLGEHVVQAKPVSAELGCGCANRLSELAKVDDGSNAKLGGLLSLCVDSRWCKCADGALSDLLTQQGVRQFSTTARRRVRLAEDERLPDTLSIAWQVCREQAEVLLQARSAWGLLTDMVRKRCVEVDVSRYMEEERMFSPELMSVVEGEGQHVVGDGVRAKFVDFEGVRPLLAEVEGELVSAGFDRTLVRAVNRRLLDIALNARKHHEHTMAAKDEVLSMLVPSAQARRDWMTLLIGSRRTGRSLLVSSAGERARVIAAIVRSWPKEKTA